MRMDRYENIENNSETKQTRTNKNQELYSDVYLNNVYVDINSLKDVVKDNNQEVVEDIKVVHPVESVNYNYEEKNYDINNLIDEAIKNKKDDKLKRSLDIGVNNLEIDSLIESINENQSKEKELEKDNENENLLSDLLPNDDNTKVIPPLEEPILDTKLISKNILQKEEETENLPDSSMKDIESDTSFVEDKKSRLKVVLSIIFVLIVISIVIYILVKKDII